MLLFLLAIDPLEVSGLIIIVVVWKVRQDTKFEYEYE